MTRISDEGVKAEPLYAAIGKFGWVYDLGLKLFGYTKSVDLFVQALCEEAESPLNVVLDAGCGTGQYSLALLRRLPKVRLVAFDLQESMVERARANVEQAGFENRVCLFTADVAGPLTEIQEKFDAIVISGVLEYVSATGALANLARFLRPGGYVLHSPVRNTFYGRLVGLLYRFRAKSREEYISVFISQGFQLRRVYTLPPFNLASFKEAHIFQKS